MSTIINIEKSFTPNQFREAVNDNFSSLNTDSTTFLRLDGSESMEANLSVGGYQINDLGAGVLSTDAVNKSQMDSAINRMLSPNTVYIVPDYTSAPIILYIDGTSGSYAVKAGNLTDAWSSITGEDVDNWWTIVISEHYNKYTDQTFSDAKNYVNVIGIGKPIITTSDNISNIIKFYNIKLHNVTTNFNTSKANYFGCDLRVSNGVSLTEVLNVGSNSILDGCNIFVSTFNADSTATNILIDNCKSTVDYPTNNNPYTINKVISNLTDYFSNNFKEQK